MHLWPKALYWRYRHSSLCWTPWARGSELLLAWSERFAPSWASRPSDGSCGPKVPLLRSETRNLSDACPSYPHGCSRSDPSHLSLLSSECWLSIPYLALNISIVSFFSLRTVFGWPVLRKWRSASCTGVSCSRRTSLDSLARRCCERLEQFLLHPWLARAYQDLRFYPRHLCLISDGRLGKPSSRPSSKAML